MRSSGAVVLVTAGWPTLAGAQAVDPAIATYAALLDTVAQSPDVPASALAKKDALRSFCEDYAKSGPAYREYVDELLALVDASPGRTPFREAGSRERMEALRGMFEGGPEKVSYKAYDAVALAGSRLLPVWDATSSVSLGRV